MGRITQSSPPFFSDELYQLDTNGIDEIYQATLEVEEATITTSNVTDKEAK
jgi:hypothetical protein